MARALQFETRQAIQPGIVEGLSQITPQQRAIGFVRNGGLQIRLATRRISQPDPTQALPEPGVAERAVQCDGALKSRERFPRAVSSAEHKSFESVCRGVAWAARKRSLEHRERGF